MKRRDGLKGAAAMLSPLLCARAVGAASPDTSEASSSPGPTRMGLQSRTGQRYAPVLPGARLAFPRDHGAHPLHRTEWWYLTGWLDDGKASIGMQITFFRVRTSHDDANPSRFAPKQLLLAHAALAPSGETALRHDQRAARSFGSLASFREDDTALRLDGWSLHRAADDRYRASISARDFSLSLEFIPAGPPVLQGESGLSRKGPEPAQASWYYSRPQMSVSGQVALAAPGSRASAAAARPVTGKAWLDHEWSSELLAPSAVGWDWVGLNLDDGTALMAFRIRSREGGVVWSHARWLDAGMIAGRERTARQDAAGPVVRFEPLRQWRSPRSGASYPVSMAVVFGARRLELHPLFDDQELDTRMSTGTLYWEGAVRVMEGGQPVGRGYLELTGYARALRL